MLPLRIGSGKGFLAGTCFTLIRRETLALGAALRVITLLSALRLC